MPDMKIHQPLLLILFTIFGLQLQAQDDVTTPSISTKYIEKVSSLSNKVQDHLSKKSEKALKKLKDWENRSQKKLAKTDSLKAAVVFADAKEKYQQLEERLKKAGSTHQYIPSLDTLATSLKFLQENPALISKSKEAVQKLKDATANIDGLKEKFQNAEEIKKFLKERTQFLRTQLSGSGLGQELKQLNKQAYYFNQQLNEYKAMLTDHKKAERKVIEVLSKTKLFRDFFHNNSQLASLFRLPADPNSPGAQASLAGLQTRAQVNGFIQQQLAAGGPNAQAQFQQNIQSAQGQLNQLKNKLTQLGQGNSNDIMPEGFRPNDQKTRSFMRRLEFGTNFQSQKPNGYFPVTSDIGLSLGYKLNEKSVLGIGTSYKMGWGKNIRNINITHQGVGLRSFMDWKVKGSFWLSGGYEMNYRNEFNRIDALKDLNAWQQSGLVGLSKIVSLRSKFSKKIKTQLLWDFLSYQQVPATQAIIFRIGYTIK
jgi:hypothetical protein